MKLSYRLLILACIAVAIAAAGCATSKPSGNTNKNSSTNVNASQPKTAADTPPAKTSQPGTGSIEVSSTPSGARVLLIAVDEGGAGEPQARGLTPTTITAVYPGKYTVDLEKPGYRFFQKDVVVKENKIAKVNATLRKQ
jgi:ABC-type Fe3+-hydroxamate transport system substrate-binding protein